MKTAYVFEDIYFLFKSEWREFAFITLSNVSSWVGADGSVSFPLETYLALFS